MALDPKAQVICPSRMYRLGEKRNRLARSVEVREVFISMAARLIIE